MTEMAVKYQNYYLGFFFMFLFQRMLFLCGDYWSPLCNLLQACDNQGKNVVAEHWYIFEVFSNFSLLVQEEWQEEEAQEDLGSRPPPQGVSGSRWAEWWTAKKVLVDLDPPWIAPGDWVPVKLEELHPSLQETDQQLFHLAATCRIHTLQVWH